MEGRVGSAAELITHSRVRADGRVFAKVAAKLALPPGASGAAGDVSLIVAEIGRGAGYILRLRGTTPVVAGVGDVQVFLLAVVRSDSELDSKGKGNKEAEVKKSHDSLKDSKSLTGKT